MRSFSGDVVNNKYFIRRKIGHGGFGDVYQAQSMHRANGYVVKIENGRYAAANLSEEAEVYIKVHHHRLKGFPNFYGYFPIRSRYCIVLQQLGEDLHEKIRRQGAGLHTSEVSLIACSLIRRLYDLHKIGYIHRDLKPSNILYGGNENPSRIYLIDLGLAHSFVDKRGNHVRSGRDQIGGGTNAFGSFAFHLKNNQSRRDDLQSLIFVLVYLLNRRLPWIHEQNNHMLLQYKINFPQSTVFKGLPRQIREVYEYISTLHYAEKPDYRWMESRFRRMRRHTNA